MTLFAFLYVEANLKTILSSLGIALGVHILCKLIFGKMASMTYVLVGIVVYNFFMKVQKKYR